MTPKLPRYANRCDASGATRTMSEIAVPDMWRICQNRRQDPERRLTPAALSRKAVLTNGLAAIAGRDTSGGAAGSIAIWLLRVVQPKEADGLGSTVDANDTRERVSVTNPDRSTWIGSPCQSSWSFQDQPDCRPQELLYSTARKQGNCPGKLKNQD